MIHPVEYRIIQDLKAISGTKAKEDYLKALSEEDQKKFRTLAQIVYQPTPTNIKKIPDPKSTKICAFQYNDDATLPIMQINEMIHEGGFGSDESKRKLVDLFSYCSEEINDVLVRILKKNLDCGVSAKTVNKVFPGTLFIPPYMRASNLNESNYHKIQFPCYSQVKADGKFVNIVVTVPEGSTITVDDVKDGNLEDHHVEIFSRDWKSMQIVCSDPLWIMTAILREMRDSGPEHLQNETKFVLHGEALVVDEFGEVLPREIGNGYLNRDDVDPSRVIFKMWDIVPGSIFFDGKKCADDLNYSYRLFLLTKLLDESYDNAYGFPATVIPTRSAMSREEVEAQYADARARGEEGIMLKNRMLLWKSHTSPDMMKVKVEVDCEMKVVGYTLGENNKYHGMIASLDIASSDGMIQCSVGSGLSDEQRENVEFWDGIIEKEGIVTVTYNDVTSNASRPGIYSLYLPRIIEVRDDKTEADCYHRIMEQLASPKIFK